MSSDIRQLDAIAGVIIAAAFDNALLAKTTADRSSHCPCPVPATPTLLLVLLLPATIASRIHCQLQLLNALVRQLLCFWPAEPAFCLLSPCGIVQQGT